jgi:hypothetical protein
MLPCNLNIQSASRFLLDRAGLPADVVKQVEERSVASFVNDFLKLQGLLVHNHAGDLAEVALTKEQKTLVGKSYASSLMNLNNGRLIQVNRPCCSSCSLHKITVVEKNVLYGHY